MKTILLLLILMNLLSITSKADIYDYTYLPIYTYDANTNTKYFFSSRDPQRFETIKLIIIKKNDLKVIDWNYEISDLEHVFNEDTILNKTKFVFEFEEKSNSLIVYNGVNLIKFDGNDGTILKTYDDMLEHNGITNINNQFVYNIVEKVNEKLKINRIDVETELKLEFIIDYISDENTKVFLTKNSKYLAITSLDKIYKYNLDTKVFDDSIENTYDDIKDILINNEGNLLIYQENKDLTWYNYNTNSTLPNVIDYGLIKNKIYYKQKNKDLFLGVNFNNENRKFFTRESYFKSFYIFESYDDVMISYPNEIYMCDEMPSPPFGYQFFTYEENKLYRYPDLQMHNVISAKINKNNELLTFNGIYYEAKSLGKSFKYLYSETKFSEDEKSNFLAIEKHKSKFIILKKDSSMISTNFNDNLINSTKLPLSNVKEILSFNNNLYAVTNNALYNINTQLPVKLVDLNNSYGFYQNEDFFFVRNSGDSTLIFYNDSNYFKISNMIDDKKYTFCDFDSNSNSVLFTNYASDSEIRNSDGTSFVYYLNDNTKIEQQKYFSQMGRFINSENIVIVNFDFMAGSSLRGNFEFININTKEDVCDKKSFGHYVNNYFLSPDKKYLYSNTCASYSNIYELCPEAHAFKSVSLEKNDLIKANGNNLIFQNKVSNIRIVDFLASYTELKYKPEIDISSYQRGVYILQFTYKNEIYNYKFIKE